MFCVWGILCSVFGEFICIMDKRQLYDLQGLFRPLWEVTDLLPCAVELITHQYALVSFMDIFDYSVKVNDLTEVQAF